MKECRWRVIPSAFLLEINPTPWLFVVETRANRREKPGFINEKERRKLNN
jgi:hypothetical protein